MKNTDLLLIFTRNPEAGKVKTRLAADIGDLAALEIYRFLLNHTAGITKNLEMDKLVYFTESIPAEDDIWDENIFGKKLQQGKDLGEKMKNAFAEGFENGYQKIVIIGSDMYDLSNADLEKAFELLEQNESVIGPAEDGGYYLLGLRSPAPQLFANKTWGTDSVLRNTLKDLSGTRTALLEERNDIDVAGDIKAHHHELQQILQHYKK